MLWFLSAYQKIYSDISPNSLTQADAQMATQSRQDKSQHADKYQS